MRLRAVLASLPEGYEFVQGRRGWLAYEREAKEGLAAVGFGPDGGEALAESDLSGRAPLGSILWGSERWIVRRFQHGGVLRVLGERLFLRPERPFEELAVAAALRGAGFPTPRVIAARAVRDAPLGWRLALISARVEGVSDGAEVLEQLRQNERTSAERRRFLGSVGELVGRLHAGGFLHADLNPRNVLLGSDLAKAWILDLDRGRLLTSLSSGERRDNLRRLYRAARRREARGRSFLSRSDCVRFLVAYARGRGQPGHWREDWRAIDRRSRRREPIHRFGWWLEGLFRAGAETRDGAAVPRS